MSRTISSGEPVHDVGDAEVLLGRVDEYRSEMDAREEGFNKVMEAGERMIDSGHFAADEVSVQGLYGSWKTWKVIEFYSFIFRAWKVIKLKGGSWKVMEKQCTENFLRIKRQKDQKFKT